MELGDRKRNILHAIIDSYIETAEPVGSRNISKRKDLNLSPATIRNEMSDLEEMGFLEQPHTSAGRVPSNMGYRLYVDSLMDRYRLSLEEMEKMNKALRIKFDELDTLIEQAGKMLADVSNYTSFAVAPNLKSSYISKFDIIPVSDRTFLLVLLTSGGVIKNSLFRADVPLNHEALKKLNVLLNLTVADCPIGEITVQKIIELEGAMREYSSLIVPILRYVASTVSELDGGELYLSGTKNILNHPEFRDIEKAKQFFDLLDDSEQMQSIIIGAENNLGGDSDTAIIIGKESNVERLKESSIIMCRFKAAPGMIGILGIIGPTRMDYSKVRSNLEYFTHLVNKILKKALSDDDE